MRVLLIEDDELDQELIGRWLGDRGHEVTIVDNGISALSELHKGTFDACLCDVNLPVEKGTVLKKRLESSGIRVILCSGASDFEPEAIDKSEMAILNALESLK